MPARRNRPGKCGTPRAVVPVTLSSDPKDLTPPENALVDDLRVLEKEDPWKAHYVAWRDMEAARMLEKRGMLRESGFSHGCFVVTETFRTAFLRKCVEIEILSAVPESLRAGRAYDATIRLRHDGTRWPYDRDALQVHLMAGGSEGISVIPVGSETTTICREGGASKPVTYRIKADGSTCQSRLVVKIVNEFGLTFGRASFLLTIDTPLATISP